MHGRVSYSWLLLSIQTYPDGYNFKTSLGKVDSKSSDHLWDLGQLPVPEGGQCVIRGGVAWGLGVGGHSWEP